MHDQPRRSWWGRNWKWAAPSGCLLLVVLAIGGCAAFFAFVVGSMKSTGAYAEAIERVQRNPDAIAALGEPITASWMIEGHFNDSGDTGDARYSLPVSGPNGSGTLRVQAVKRDGIWRFQQLELAPEGGGTIELLTPDERAENGDGENVDAGEREIERV